MSIIIVTCTQYVIMSGYKELCHDDDDNNSYNYNDDDDSVEN